MSVKGLSVEFKILGFKLGLLIPNFLDHRRQKLLNDYGSVKLGIYCLCQIKHYTHSIVKIIFCLRIWLESSFRLLDFFLDGRHPNNLGPIIGCHYNGRHFCQNQLSKAKSTNNFYLRLCRGGKKRWIIEIYGQTRGYKENKCKLISFLVSSSLQIKKNPIPLISKLESRYYTSMLTC